MFGGRGPDLVEDVAGADVLGATLPVVPVAVPGGSGEQAHEDTTRNRPATTTIEDFFIFHRSGSVPVGRRSTPTAAGPAAGRPT